MKIKYLLIGVMLLVGCGKDEEVTPDGVVPAPTAAVLVSPLQNEVCTTGTILSDTESQITFVWKAAENADSYELNYKNLETGSATVVTSTSTTATIKMLRNTPYSWKVITKSSKTNTIATSEVWKFYNAGNGVVSYAPYPAEIVSPLLGSTVTPVSGKISLTWKGTDPDGDITSYQVYFGTATNPPLYKNDLSVNSLSDIPVNNNSTYYWIVVTKDSKGNTSTSGISQFRTN
ncbi:hypothetical protein [Pedobacter sp. BMA]|uniref:hypothetical protein n=1 Tax=Pedobacter sp. BMA TaxID=1663685 RepID=UPI0006496A20|nr:hypothetical protein [Pedobacter sp. BMA]KLT64045.1 hypothetical protein AB669_18445 [Pedobacter sp. BMA]